MPTLPALLSEAQNLFAPYRAAYPLAICTCASCMPLDEQRRFLATPLDALTPAQLQSYLTSVPLDGQDEKYIRELKHFLPRILTGLCAFEDLSPLSETTLHHLALDRPDLWHTAERNYLHRFACAFIAARCRGDAPLPSAASGEWRISGDSIANNLLMFHWARLPDLAALTDIWTAHAAHLPALRDYIDLLQHMDWTHGDIDWRQALYLPEHCPERATLIRHLRDWFHAPATRRAFRAALEHALLHDLAPADEQPLWESWYDWLDDPHS